MQMQYCASVILTRVIWLYLIVVFKETATPEIYTTRGLDDPGNIALFGKRIGVAQIVTAILAMAREVPVLPPVNAFPFLPAQNGAILNIKRFLRIMCQFVGAVFTQTHAIFVIDDPLVPV